MTTTVEEEQTKAVATTAPTQSERFTDMVLREFSGAVGDGVEMTPHQRKLAQHLFIKIDVQLKELEAKRVANGQNQKEPIVWENVNLPKLAVDAMHRIDLGLDALIENHISPIPYWNTKDKKYDLDLRIGYKGKDYYRRKVAIETPKGIIYQLVYSTDKFKPIMRSKENGGDTYEFEITQPFDRGDVIGGFGYVIYDDPSRNMLVLVQKKQLEQSERDGNKEFWTKRPDEMKYKTIVHRTTDKLNPDPEKVTESYFIVEAQDNELEVQAEIAENANREELDVESDEAKEEPKQAGPEF